ncbi:glutathione S-transferase family protein [Tateyamaria sp.]|uniref:glutathione S-transferase family protein n=1 Tax=Tateyamaria sp. TaxID=1929288 RepID=UPI00329D81A4
MIDFYTWPTPNCRKVSILLEELALPYEVHPIDINGGAQNTPEFLVISPNNKVPAIVDRETGFALFESGAILLYLAEKHGKFLPADLDEKAEVTQWVMWQMGGLGPMAGQTHHFVKNNPGKAPYAEDRFKTEVARLYRVLDKQLSGRDYICGDYSIADMASWPWVSRHEWHQINLADYPNVRVWYRRILARDAVQKGYHVPVFANEIPTG